MGSDPDRQPPFFFTKPGHAVVDTGSMIRFPPRTQNLHHEVELVVALCSGGANIEVKQAPSCIFGYGVGVDLTRRDLQAEAKAAGRPWDMAKGFDNSAPVGPICVGVPPSKGEIRLSVNDDLRQLGDLKNMIWSVPEIIAELSSLVTLEPGDLIFTGTPAGVGPLLPGNKIHALVEDAPPLEIAFASSPA
jgi:fumarylpyruvate hydrolase